VQVVGDVVYHSRPGHVVYFAIAILKRVVLQKRNIFPFNLQGIKSTK
jgi:hypothetical protein